MRRGHGTLAERVPGTIALADPQRTKRLNDDMPICRLCLANVKQLRNSHIVPEFFYKEIYGDKKQFMVFSDRHARPVMAPQQKGLRQHLLCQSCETHFSRWETYAARILRGPWSGVNDHPDHTEYTGVAYDLLKLFLLSILWRMSITDRPGFAAVQLGPVHEERIRMMLLDSTPNAPAEYGCRLSSHITESPRLRQAFLAPTTSPSKVFGHTCYRMVLGGLFWAFFVPDGPFTFPAPEQFLLRDGVLRVWKEDDKVLAYLRDMFEPVHASNAGYLQDYLDE